MNTPRSETATIAEHDSAAVAPTSALHYALPHVLRTLRREPAVAITLGYILVALAGIFFNYSYYRQFGIPVLSLSQITDFLASGLQQPIALLLLLSTFPLMWLTDKFNLHTRRKQAEKRLRLAQAADSRWNRLKGRLILTPPKWFTVFAYLVLVVFYSWTFITVYADHSVARVLAGEAPLVHVQMSSDPGGIPALERDAAWTYLGAVSNYVFVYDRASKRAMVLPVNNIVRIESVPDRRAENAAAKTGANPNGMLLPFAVSLHKNKSINIDSCLRYR